MTDPADQIVCHLENITAVTFATDNTGGTVSYAWTNDTPSIGLAASGSGDIAAFAATNPTDAPVTATITVTPTFTNGGKSCVGPSEQFTITVNPTAHVTDPADQIVCHLENITAVTFATDNTGGTVSYAWTNDTPSIGLAASGSGDIAAFAATNPTDAPVTATITVTPTFTNGGKSCVGPSEQFTITVNPTAHVTDPADQIVCHLENITAVTFATDNTGGTVSYAWTNDTPSIGLAASGSGDIAAFAATNPTDAPVTATITVTPTFTNGGKSCVGPSEQFTITVNPTAHVTDPADQIVCHLENITAVTFATDNTGGTVSYAWTNDTPSIGLAASGSGDIAAFAATNPTDAPVTATITVTPTFTNGGKSCVGPSEQFTITVNPTAHVTDPADQIVCHLENITAVTFATDNTGGTVSYAWTNDTPSIGLAASGSGDIAAFAATNPTDAPVTATITVTPTFTNGGKSCVGPSEQFTITVNPTAHVTDPADQIVCHLENITAVTFATDNTGGTVSYAWTNDTPSIGLAASGSGDIAAFAATNPTDAPVTATITVTPTFTNGGKSCVGPSEQFTITVNPTAHVTDPADQIVCHLENITAVTFATDNTGGTVSYAWTNDTPSIGLAASGSGDIAAFAATNPTDAPVTATITVTPTFTNGGKSCVGPSEQFTITVNPTAHVTDPADQIVCHLENITAVTFATDNTGGTVSYAWTNDTPSIGLAASGSGDIAAFAATNPTDAPVTATITVTPTFTNGGKSCVGPSEQFTITVNPTAHVTDPADQIVCHLENITAVTFATDNTGGTVSYAWTNDTPSIGLAASGSGDIAAFAATNPTDAPVTATITVTPTFTNGGKSCVGPSEQFTITVNPTAHVTDPADQIVCHLENITAVTFATDNTGGTVSYAWTNDTPSIGLAASGSGDIAAFAATNPTDAPVTATITVTPTFTNGGKSCVGPSEQFTITVNPTAHVTDPADQIVCHLENITAVTFATDNTGGTVSYAWTNDTPSIGLAASGSGDIAAFAATNPTDAPVTATITVTPTFTNGGKSCVGPSEQFTITVNPTAHVTTRLIR